MSPDERAERFGRLLQNDEDIAPPIGNDRMVTQLMAALVRYQRVDPDTHAWALPEVVLDHAGGLVLNPALAVVTADRWERVRDRIWGAPNVIVEVIDKRRARRTRHVRVRWYRDFGVQECWLLDSRVQRIEVLDLQQRRLPYIYSLEAEFSSRILRGFRMPVADIFPCHDAVRPE